MAPLWKICLVAFFCFAAPRGNSLTDPVSDGFGLSALARNDIEETEAISEDDELSSDVSLSQLEVREKFHNGGALSLGEMFPWQLYSAEIFTLKSGRRGWSFFAGGGRFSKRGGGSSKETFDVHANVYSFGAAHRFFFSASLPVAIVASASLGQMSGHLTPRSSEVDEVTPGSNFLTSSFRTHLATFAAGFCLNHTWENGMFLEWNVISMKKSWAFRYSIDRAEQERKDEMKKFTNQAKLYGLINLKIGYFFN